MTNSAMNDDEHQRRTEHGVEEELQRCVLAVVAAPHADHEVHRQQHQFEEDEEQDQVLGDERAGHAGLQDEHQDEERLRIARRRHVVPRVDHHQQGDDHRQEVQRQADAVETDRVRRPDRPDPAVGGEELQLLRLAVVELHQRVHADANVASAVTTAMPLISASSRFGMNSITSTPASGRKVPRLSSHCWS